MRRFGTSMALVLVLGASVWMGPPAEARGQTLTGRVLDEVLDAPVAGAAVALLDRDGKTKIEVLADGAGRFTVTPPRAGEYFISVSRFGYEKTVSPLLTLHAEGRRTLDLLMTPAPVGLEGFEVAVEDEAEDFLGLMGMTPTQLGNRWFGREAIEAVHMKRDPGSVIEWGNLPGVTVIRRENMNPSSGGGMGLCVTMTRARRGRGTGTCATVVFNGIIVTSEVLLSIDPDDIESMALLTPVEATTFYGENGAYGVLMVWTRRGGK